VGVENKVAATATAAKTAASGAAKAAASGAAAGERGETYIDLVIKVMVAMVFVALIVRLPEPFLKYQNLSYACRTVTRAVEAAGGWNSDVDALVRELDAKSGLVPTIDFRAPGGGARVEYRERFSVTMEVKHRVTLLDLSFAGPLEYTIPLRVTSEGVGEVYWK